MGSRRKYKQGAVVKTLISAVMLIDAEVSLYYNHKFMSWKWMQHWSVTQLRGAVISRRLRIAERIVDDKA